MKILIVDDSVTFRMAIKHALAGEPGIEAMDVAANGKIALAKLEGSSFDVMILDLEMPEMDGLAVVEALSKRRIDIRTLIFAAPSEENYKKVSLALRLGADDFLAKPSNLPAAGDVEAAVAAIRADLLPRVRSLASKGRPASQPSAPASAPRAQGAGWQKRDLGSFRPSAIVIASSTGGPMALEKVFAHITAPISIPIFLAQHMPPPFTKGLAERLAEITGVVCQEGSNGDVVTANRIYVAPADYHMTLRLDKNGVTIRISQEERINFVRPAADPLFASAAGIYQQALMAFVLTGMGEDGKEGACTVKRSGGGVMIQDEASSVVWGMPGAVYREDAFDAIGDLAACATTLQRMVMNAKSQV